MLISCVENWYSQSKLRQTGAILVKMLRTPRRQSKDQKLNQSNCCLQPGYTTTAMNYDFALVTLAIPATSGYLSLYIPPSSIGSTKPTLATAGYPGSKPSGTMWSSACGNTTIDYSNNNAFANVAQCTGGVSLFPISDSSLLEED